LTQSGERPDLYRESFRFEMMPFEAGLAGVMEDIRSVRLKVLIQP
jgi:hypothetical protein